MFSILNEHEEPLLNRKSLIIKAEFPKKATPSQATLKKELAAFLKAEENRIVIKVINQQFGTSAALITINLYKDEPSLKAIEHINKRKKKEGAEQSGKEAQAKK